MTHLLIVLAVTCGIGVDILVESQPDGRLTKRGCCQRSSVGTVGSVPTADPVAAVKPCYATQAATGNTTAAPAARSAGLPLARK